LFEKYGIENCFIELIESFPCKCNDELRKKEREWFDKIKCVNMARPFVTKEERVEKEKECSKIYYEANKELIMAKVKTYQQENKEQIAEYHKEYKQANKEQIAENAKEAYECQCGSIIRKDSKTRHEKTKKHQNYLLTINTFCTTAVTESL
jgi:hypothetical protein